MKYSNCQSIHELPYPFPMLPTIEGQLNGGLPAVYAHEYEMNRGRMDRVLNFVTTDDRSHHFPLHNVYLHAADPSNISLPYEEWFYRRWAYLHPDAHTNAAVPQDVLDRMYVGADYTTSSGSLERMIEHCNLYPLHLERVEAFTARFRGYMENLLRLPSEPDSNRRIINWQDPIFYAELQNEYAQRLRKAGYYQTCHVHTVLPIELNQSSWGTSMIKGLAQMDSVYVHTEGYRRNLEAQLPDTERRPDIRRFDLGIDTPLIRKIFAQITDDNCLQQIQYADMTQEQKNLVDEVLRTKKGAERVPHRFICLDRADPGKGLVTLIDAVDLFLQRRLEGGETMQDLRKNYRFFGLHGLLSIQRKEPDTYDLKDRYIAVVRERFDALKQKFPGIVFTCEGMNKVAAVYMMDDCHALTGTAQDGLNLVWPETIWANAHNDRNRSGIMVRGAGFAQEAIRRGVATSDGPPYFPEVNHLEQFVDAMNAIVRIQQNQPELLGRSSRQFVEEYIDQRTDSVIVDS